MANKAQVMKRVEELGCTIDYDGEEVTIDAPDGYWFVAGIHGFTNVKSEGENTMSEVWDECLMDMQGGIERCTDKECDICEHYA